MGDVLLHSLPSVALKVSLGNSQIVKVLKICLEGGRQAICEPRVMQGAHGLDALTLASGGIERALQTHEHLAQ